MNRLYAAFLLLPMLILSFMTAKARSHSGSKTSKSRAARPFSAVDDNASSPLTPLTAEQSNWVDSSLRSMSLEEKVGQLLFTTYHGSFASTDSEAFAQMMHDINDLHPWFASRHRQGSGLSHRRPRQYAAVEIQAPASGRR
jgi:hypothetical protein